MSSGINPQVYIWKSCLGTNTGWKLRKWLPWTGLIHLVHRLRCMLVKTAWQHLPLCTNDFHQKAYHNPVERMRCWKSNEQPLGNRQQPYPRASWTRKTSRASTHLLQFMEKQASCPANLTNHWRGSQFSGARKEPTHQPPLSYISTLVAHLTVQVNTTHTTCTTLSWYQTWFLKYLVNMYLTHHHQPLPGN